MCCKHRNTLFETSGRKCHAYMTSMVLSYKLPGWGSESTINRTLCIPFPPSECVHYKATDNSGSLVLRQRAPGRRKMTLGWKELHTFAFVVENTTQVQLRGVADVAGMDRNLVSRKRPRAMTLPKVVNLCGKGWLPAGETTCMLTPECKRMQLARPQTAQRQEGGGSAGGAAAGSEIFEIGTTGKVILSNTHKQTGCIRIVGTDNLYKTIQTLSHLCNIDPLSTPSVHMGIFCATQPHSTTMSSCRANVDRVLRLYPNMFR